MAHCVYMSNSDPRFLSSNYYLAVVRLKAMNWKYAFATLIVLIGHDFVSSQQIPSTTTAAELWNPWTWFWPYAIATAEGFRDYYQKAQKATNELYQQAYKTNAFPWMTGNWGGNPSQGNQGGNSGQQGGQANQGGTGGQANQGGTGGQASQGGTGGQASQGGTGGQTNQEGTGGQTNQGGTGGQTNQEGTGGQTNQEGTGGQTNQEETGGQTNEGDNTQTQQPVEENQTENPGTGAQVQGNVNDDGTGNAEINGTV